MKTINYREQLEIAQKYDLSVYDLQIALTAQDCCTDFCPDCSDAEFERICEAASEADNKLNSFTDYPIEIDEIVGAIVRLRVDGVEWKKICANRFALVAKEVQ